MPPEWCVYSVVESDNVIDATAVLAAGGIRGCGGRGCWREGDGEGRGLTLSENIFSNKVWEEVEEKERSQLGKNGDKHTLQRTDTLTYIAFTIFISEYIYIYIFLCVYR